MAIGLSNKNEPENDDDFICQYCHKSGGLFKCEKCDEHTHIYCAFAKRTPPLLKDEDSQEGWRIVIEENQTPEEKTVNLLCSAKMPKFSQKIIKKAGSQELLQSSSQIKGLDSIKHEEERYKQIWVNLDKGLKKEIPGFPLATYSKKTVLKLQCEEDRESEVFCHCLKPYNVKPKNFGCESCSNWYHCICTGVDPGEISKITKYFCKQCRDWFSFRKSIFTAGKVIKFYLNKRINLFYRVPHQYYQKSRH